MMTPDVKRVKESKDIWDEYGIVSEHDFGWIISQALLAQELKKDIEDNLDTTYKEYLEYKIKARRLKQALEKAEGFCDGIAASIIRRALIEFEG